MVSIGKLEFDNLWASFVEMGIFFRIIGNRFERRLELSNVDTSRSDIGVDVLCKSLEVIKWVLALGQIVPKLLIGGFLGIDDLLSFSLFRGDSSIDLSLSIF